MKRYSSKDIIISAVVLILVVVLATVLGDLKALEIINVKASAFIFVMMILTLGAGLYVTAFSIFKKGGYEFAVGGILTVIGAFLLQYVLSVDIIVNLIVTFGLFLVVIVSGFLFRAKFLTFETTDKKDDYVPYMEKLKREKEEEPEEELPEIKSFKN